MKVSASTWLSKNKKKQSKEENQVDQLHEKRKKEGDLIEQYTDEHGEEGSGRLFALSLRIKKEWANEIAWFGAGPTYHLIKTCKWLDHIEEPTCVLIGTIPIEAIFCPLCMSLLQQDPDHELYRTKVRRKDKVKSSAILNTDSNGGCYKYSGRIHLNPNCSGTTGNKLLQVEVYILKQKSKLRKSIKTTKSRHGGKTTSCIKKMSEGYEKDIKSKAKVMENFIYRYLPSLL
jgi:hypothetical protein